MQINPNSISRQTVLSHHILPRSLVLLITILSFCHSSSSETVAEYFDCRTCQSGVWAVPRCRYCCWAAGSCMVVWGEESNGSEHTEESGPWPVRDEQVVVLPAGFGG